MMTNIVRNHYRSNFIFILRALLLSQVAVRNSSTISPTVSKFASMKVDLYFVRHGETEANRDNILQGHCDFPLTDKGLKQCEQVGEALRSVRWNKVFSSDLLRTVRTSQILLSKSETYDSGGIERLREDILLREMNFGVKEMLPRDTEFEAAIQIVAMREGIRCEDVVDSAETNSEVKIRQHKFISETIFSELVSQGFPGNSIDVSAPPTSTSTNNQPVVLRPQENPKILCVSHGGFIRRFLTNFCDVEYTASADFPGSTILSSVFGVKDIKLVRLSNCSISKVTVEWPLGSLHGDFVCRAKSDEVNIITHLKDQ